MQSESWLNDRTICQGIAWSEFFRSVICIFTRESAGTNDTCIHRWVLRDDCGVVNLFIGQQVSWFGRNPQLLNFPMRASLRFWTTVYSVWPVQDSTLQTGEEHQTPTHSLKEISQQHNFIWVCYYESHVWSFEPYFWTISYSDC